LDQVWTSARLPGNLRAIAMRALSREPKDRYASAAELKADLIQYVRGAPDFPRSTYKKGEIVVREGEIGGAAYVIREGRCQAFKVVQGQKVVLRTMGPGEAFGELAILSSKPRTASVEALEDLTLEVVDANTLREGVGLHTWLGPFVSALVERF